MHLIGKDYLKIGQSMIRNSIATGDILYDPISDEICEVKSFRRDGFNQQAVVYQIKKQDEKNKSIDVKITSAWIVFLHFIKLGRV